MVEVEEFFLSFGAVAVDDVGVAIVEDGEEGMVGTTSGPDEPTRRVDASADQTRFWPLENSVARASDTTLQNQS